MDHLENFDKKDYGLLPARMDSWGGMLFVNLDGQAPPLDQYLGDLPDMLSTHPFDDLVPAHTKIYEIDCNWKLTIENFLEWYHLPSVHPALCAVSGVDEHIRYQGQGMYAMYLTSPLTNGGTEVDPDIMPKMPGLGEMEANSAVHLSIFPNMFTSIYPHHQFLVTVEPIAGQPGKCVERARLLVYKDVAADKQFEEQVRGAFLFHDNVNREDLAVCEAVQKGTAAYGCKPGRFSYQYEESVYRFQNMVADAVTGKLTIYPGDK